MKFTSTTSLPPKVRSLVESEISGEQALWIDQPIPGRYARQAWILTLFGIPWTVFSIIWTWGAFHAARQFPGSQIAILFPLFGVPFILAGLGMLFSPYWLKLRARNTVYILTQRRAIIISCGWLGGLNVRSFEPARMRDIQRRQHADGSGDIIFLHDWRYDAHGNSYSTNVGFKAVRDVKSVEDLIRSMTGSQ
jgi:hypothetical protein